LRTQWRYRLPRSLPHLAASLAQRQRLTHHGTADIGTVFIQVTEAGAMAMINATRPDDERNTIDKRALTTVAVRHLATNAPAPKG